MDDFIAKAMRLAYVYANMKGLHDRDQAPAHQVELCCAALLAHLERGTADENLHRAARNAVRHFDEFSESGEVLANSGFGLAMDWLSIAVEATRQKGG